MRSYALLAATLLLLCATARAGNDKLDKDDVLQWNRQLAITVQLAGNPGSFSSPHRSAVLMSGAIYDAVNAIKDKFEPFIVKPSSIPSNIRRNQADAQAAATEAAYTILTKLYPGSGTSESVLTYHNTLREMQLAKISDGVSKTEGIELGAYVANAILQNRSTDGWPPSFSQAPNCSAGGTACAGKYMYGFSYYYPTSGGRIPDTSYSDQVKPFTLESCDVTTSVVPPPLAFSHPSFYADWHELWGYGTSSAANNTMTPAKSEMAMFHQSVSNWGMYSDLASFLSYPEFNNLDGIDLVRSVLLITLSTAESHLCHLWLKWHYLNWRPSVAYRNLLNTPTGIAALDALYDPNWTPVLPITPDAEYPSGHAARTVPYFHMLKKLFGDYHHFTATATTRPGMPQREYTSYSSYAAESGESRIIAGSHWRFSVAEGTKLGQWMADRIYNNFLRRK